MLVAVAFVVFVADTVVACIVTVDNRVVVVAAAVAAVVAVEVYLLLVDRFVIS